MVVSHRDPTKRTSSFLQVSLKAGWGEGRGEAEREEHGRERGELVRAG